MGIGKWFKKHRPKPKDIIPHHPPKPKDIIPKIDPKVTKPPKSLPGEQGIISTLDNELSKLKKPYDSLNTYIQQTEALSTALGNSAVKGLENAGKKVGTASIGAMHTITQDTEEMGQRIAAAAKNGMMRVGDTAKKLEGIPTLAVEHVEAVGNKLKNEVSNIETAHLAKLYDLINDAGNGNYNSDLKQKLTEISEAVGSLQLPVPVPEMDAALIDKVSDILSALPAEASHIVAGVFDLGELDKALKILKQVQQDKSVIKDVKKTLITTIASLKAASILLGATKEILPLSVDGQGETGVGADEKGGIGAAAGVRVAANGTVGEEGKAGGGVSFVKVGGVVCGGLATLVDFIVTILEQLQMHIPVKQGA